MMHQRPPADDTSAANGQWWRRPFSVVQTNLQEIDADLDVAATIDFIKGYGADTWLLSCAGIVSFYPTDLPFQTRSPYLVRRTSGDLVGDAVKAAHDSGIRVIARLDLSKVAEPIAQAHPDWLYVSPNGEPQIYNGLYSVCPSGEYYQQRSLEILDEMLTRYPVDGFFFNWFNFNERDYSNVYRGVCQCASCRLGFSDRGGELPTGMQSPNFWEWLTFSNEVTADITRRISEHIHGQRSDVALVLRKNASVRYHEAAHAIGEETWHHETSESVGALVNLDPTVPVMVNSVSFVDMPYRMGAEQPARFAQYLSQTIARGGRPSTYFMGAPGRIPYANLAKGGEVNRFYSAQQHLYEQLEPAARVALVRPNRFAMRPPDYVAALAEFRGVYSMLQQVHVPFDVIAIESLDDLARSGRLDRFGMVILPSPGSLRSATADAIDAYVVRGGHVVVTGTGGTDVEGRVELATSPASVRIGKVVGGQDLWSTYATLDEQDSTSEYRYRSSVVPVFGSAASYEWKKDATTLGHILPSAPYGPPEKCYGHVVGDDPAAARLVQRSGSGSVTVVPWSIGATFREFCTDEIRDFLVRVISPDVPRTLDVDLPEQVEVVLGRAGDSCVVHLLNLSGARPKAFGTPITVTGGRLRWPASDHRPTVRALVAETTLEPRLLGDEWVIDLPPLGLFEVVQLHDPTLLDTPAST